MARQIGSANFAGTLEVLAGGPIDARSIVQTKAELTVASNFPYPYVGMQTYVVAEGKRYTLTSLDVTSLSNWREESGGGSSSTVWAYYNSTDGLFYEDDSFTTLITGYTEIIYIDMPTGDGYMYDGTNYVLMNESKQDADDVIISDDWIDIIPEVPVIAITSNIGDLESLKTANKNDIVSAINEVYDTKQDILTFDDIPTDSSSNPVKSGGVYTGLAGKVDTSSVGIANGVAELDSTGKVPASQLPSYVDDVIEGYYKTSDGKFYKESTYTTEIAGEDGKIYISNDTHTSYRWTGSAFTALGGALVLGETSATAYRGDRGKTAYDISQTVGDVTNLNTTNKNTVVSAVNELVSNKQDADDVITNADWDDIISPIPAVSTDTVFAYSTTEKGAGKWIDGNLLYQKTIDFGALPNNSTKKVLHGVILINKIVNCNGFATNGSNYIPLCNPNIAIAIDSTGINITTSTDMSAYTSCFVTIQYTKQ